MKKTPLGPNPLFTASLQKYRDRRVQNATIRIAEIYNSVTATVSKVAASKDREISLVSAAFIDTVRAAITRIQFNAFKVIFHDEVDDARDCSEP